MTFKFRLNCPRRGPVLGLVLVVGALLVPRPTTISAAEPSWEKIKQVVDRRLTSNIHYRAGDLISRADVEPIFNELLDLGFQTSGEIEELYDSFLSPNDYLVKTLGTTYGQKFMRQVAGLPGVYDRLERLSWVPAGRAWLDELVVHPQGAKVFREMISPEGAKKVAQKLADDPRGRNYMLPTGHVHTADQLLKHLKQKFAPSREK